MTKPKQPKAVRAPHDGTRAAPAPKPGKPRQPLTLPAIARRLPGMPGRLYRWLGEPQRWFVLLAVIFGAIFLLKVPPMGAPDEGNHFMRAYQVATGQIVATKFEGLGTGGMIPQSIVHYLATNMPNTAADGEGRTGLGQDIAFSDDDPIRQRFENTAVYSPVVYLPHAAGILVGQLFDLPVSGMFYLARVFNLVCYIALIYGAIRLLPFGKWAGVAFGLLPMHLMLASIVAADPVSIGLMALVVAAVLRLRTLQRTITLAEMLLLALLAVLVALMKVPYQLVLLLYLFIPARVFGGQMAYWLRFVLPTAAITIAAGAAWLLAAENSSSPHGPVLADQEGQIEFLRHNHADTFLALSHTLLTELGDRLVQQAVISVGWLQAQLPEWVTMLYAAFFATTVYPLRTARGALAAWQKAILAVIMLLMVIVSSLLLYITWTEVGETEIEGLQARYFTPLLVLFIPLLAMRAAKPDALPHGRFPVWYRYAPLFFLLCGLSTILYWFHDIKILLY